MANRKPGFDEQFCPSCRAIVNERAPYCPDCGHPINPENKPGKSAGGTEDVNIGYETIDEKRQKRAEKAKKVGSSLAPMVKSTSLWVVGLFFLLGGVGSLGSPEMSPIAGVPLAIIGLVLLPPVHGLVGRDADPLSFGSRRIVKKNSVANHTEPCAACAGTIDDGVERKRIKQFLFFGGAISSSEQGRLVYCQSCARGEIAHTRDEEPTVSESTQEGSDKDRKALNDNSVPNGSEQNTIVSDSSGDTDRTDGRE